jgi:hypothetical protein
MPFDIDVVVAAATDDQQLLLVDLTKAEINEKSIRHLGSLKGVDNRGIGMIRLTGTQLSTDSAYLLSSFIYDTPSVRRISLSSDQPYRTPDERLLKKAFNTYIVDMKLMYCMFLAATNRKMPLDTLHLIFSFIDPHSERLLFNDHGMITIMQSKQYRASMFNRPLKARPSLDYDLCLKSSSDTEETPLELKKNTVYVGTKNDKLTYSVVTPSGRTVLDEMTNIPAPSLPLNLDKVRPLKSQLLDISCNAGHTLPLSLREQATLKLAELSLFRRPAPPSKEENSSRKLCVVQ